MLGAVADFLFPKRCANCKKVGSYFCQNCLNSIKITSPICPNCQSPSINGEVHPICKTEFGLDGLWTLGEYKDPLRILIQKLKYKYLTEIADILINLILDDWEKSPPLLLDEIKASKDRWLIVPTPLHKSRQNWRGFNQAELLANSFSIQSGIKVSNCLIKIKNTKPQVGMASSDRITNLKNVFLLNQEHNIQDKNILLIDDVWTTGATLKECTIKLKSGGADKVWGISIAK